MLSRLKECMIEAKTISLIENIMGQTKCAIRTNETISDPFDTTRGVPQGCCLSPCSFTLFADLVIQELNVMGLAYEIGKQEGSDRMDTAVLMYADDLVIICDDEVKLQKLINRCSEIMIFIEMDANVKKCAILHMKYKKQKQTDFQFIWTGNGKPEKLPLESEYKYLGCMIDNELSWKSHIKKVTKKAYIAFARLRKYLCDTNIPIGMRLQAFNSLITPLFAYGSESWSPCGTEMVSLSAIYDTLLAECIICVRNKDTTTMHAIAGTRHLEW